MDQTIDQLVEGELEQAGTASPITPQIIALNSHRITTETQLKKQEFLFALQGKPCFPRCDGTEQAIDQGHPDGQDCQVGECPVSQ